MRRLKKELVDGKKAVKKERAVLKKVQCNNQDCKKVYRTTVRPCKIMCPHCGSRDHRLIGVIGELTI